MPRIKSLLAYMNDELAKTDYLAGNELTATNIVMGYNLDGIEKRMQLFDFAKDYPHTNFGGVGDYHQY